MAGTLSTACLVAPQSMYAELHTNQAVPDLPGNSEWWSVVNPYQSDPNRLSDSLFEGGSLQHLVMGNEARALGYRRMPLRVRELKESSGLAVMEILDFEDVGNTWDVPFEDISSFQFAFESQRAGLKDLAPYEASVARLNKQTTITCDQDARRATLSELAEAEREPALWLGAQRRHRPRRLQPERPSTDFYRIKFGPSPIRARILSRRRVRNSDVLPQAM